MESPLEFHSLKPDNGVARLCGFGCRDYSPGRRFNADRGFLLHTQLYACYIKHVKKKLDQA